MRTYYYSALLIGCGAIYSFLSPAGFLGGGQKSQLDDRPANTAVTEQAIGDKNPVPEEQNTYPQELCVQFAVCEKSPGPGETGLQPKTLRDDIDAPRIVIATVPDPATTHLRVEFDRAIDGIKDAAADEKYLFRRYWFPWPIEPAAQSSDRTSQAAEEKQRALKRRLPGLLLFENSGHQSLIVLLVGESPTDGIHRQQFDRAIELKRKIEELGNTSIPRFYILGTSFSGSLHTLDLALKQKGIRDFDAVSGSVADKESIRSFNAREKCERCAEGRLRTVRQNSDAALTGFLKYIQNRWNYSGKVAILSETETVFGALNNLNNNVKERIFMVPFPRDIAHLRNAYQSYPELSGFGPANPDLQERKNLPLPLDDTRNTINSIPDFASQTVVSQETMVSQIANRIRHEHIHFAGIIGTDVLDVLFISRFVRAASPDTRLFVLDPDLLFVHAADALPFEGVLAVTTYPLLDGNPPFEPNTRTDDPHWVFPTPFQQGIHNAMRVLVADMAHRSVPVLPGYDIVNPGDEEPALWITSVGRESFVPIAVMEMPNAGTPSARRSLVAIPKGTRPLPRDPHEPARIWWILFLFVTFGIAGLAVVIHLAQKCSATWLSDFRIQDGVANRCQLSLFLVFSAGFYLVVVSTGIGILDYPVLNHVANPIPFLCLLIGLISIASLVWHWLRYVKLKVSSLITVGFAAAGVAATIILFVSLSNNSTNLTGAFFRFRSFELSAGAAPTIPFLFLLAGFVVCSFVNLQRSIFHHQRSQLLPRAKCDPILGGNVWHGATRLRRRLYSPFRYSRKFSIFLAAAAFVVCYYGLHESGIRSFEGIWYDRTFMAWASALAAALIVVCAYFLNSWRLLNQILDQLETHPVRRTLSALPADHSWSPIWQSNPRKRSYLIATRSMDSLTALNATGLCPAKLTTLIYEARKSVAVILRRASRGERETPKEHVAAQAALAKTADNLVHELQSVWRQGSSEILDAYKDAKGKHEDEAPPLIYGSEFVAMRYLAFIRYAMLQLRNMLTFLTLGFMAFAFALMSYPFQGERLIAWVITLLFAVLSLAIVLVFAQMETDVTLSRITNREAGKLGFDFFHRAVAFGALPLLTVLASNFNGVARLLFSWIEPAMKTLH